MSIIHLEVSHSSAKYQIHGKYANYNSMKLPVKRSVLHKVWKWANLVTTLKFLPFSQLWKKVDHLDKYWRLEEQEQNPEEPHV